MAGYVGGVIEFYALKRRQIFVTVTACSIVLERTAKQLEREGIRIINQIEYRLPCVGVGS